MFSGENSAVCVLSLISVIDKVTENDKSTAAFRKHTVELLETQALRVGLKMELASVKSGGLV